jgi:hypothetical protein
MMARDDIVAKDDPKTLGADIRRSTEAVIKRILQRQSEMTPDIVGPPFTIANFDGKKLFWIEAGECAEKKNRSDTKTKRTLP